MDKRERAIQMLNELLQRKMHSPAAYVLEASPYVAPGDEKALEEVRHLQDIANRHAEEAAQRIMMLEGVPQGGAYETVIADFNYLSVRHVLSELLRRLEEDTTLFEQYRDACEVPEARDLLATVVQDDHVPLQRIRELVRAIERERAETDTHLR